MQTQPLRLQTSCQMLPTNDGYLATISDPASEAHGFFAFGPDHHAAQRSLAQVVWDHLTATGQVSLHVEGIVLQIQTSVTWFPNSVLTRLPSALLGLTPAAKEVR
ncbi:hypothetical protein ACFV9C_42665 [Kribbella sp. NPDC059898]|uniref:hypothetical protein n=1 Tax=Kribbella sp. NPDC059898 TaxID=3346995 RepID=UPI0036693EE0